MAKAKKRKTKFILYSNEITPTPDMEISGITHMDGKEAGNQLQAAKYVSIEKSLKPIVFYDLCSLLKGDTFKSYSKRFTVSQFHGVSIEILQDSGFIECKKSDLMRGLVTTGLLSLRIKGGVNPEGTANTLKKVAELSGRVNTNNDRLELLLSRLKIAENKRSRTFLRKKVAMYGDNAYGVKILSYMADVTRSVEKPIIYKNAGCSLSKCSVSRCETISSEVLTDKMYVLDEAKEAYSLDVYMSERFWGLLAEYKRSYFAAGTQGQLLRACTVTGLYCLSKWLLKSRICKDETNFHTLCRAIEKYGVDHF